jgi:hypothetical protein
LHTIFPRLLSWVMDVSTERHFLPKIHLRYTPSWRAPDTQNRRVSADLLSEQHTGEPDGARVPPARSYHSLQFPFDNSIWNTVRAKKM